MADPDTLRTSSSVRPGELPEPPRGRTGWPWEAIPPPRTVLALEQLPRITVVTPSYNQGRYLEATLRSVLLQGYPNLEYLVLDGGSTDESCAILDRYRPWLSYLRSHPDGGQSQAINEGFARASGEILAWLNSDDLYLPGALHLAAQHLAGKPPALLVGSSLLTTTPDDLTGKLDDRFPDFAAMLYEARSYPQPSVFFTRSLWLAAGPLDESLYFAMDYELWLRMLPQAQEVVRLPDCLSIARTHPAQKGQRAAALGQTERFVQQRVCSALKAARQRGEPPWLWLARVWLRRFRQALDQRRLSLVRGSLFQRAACRAVFARNYCGASTPSSSRGPERS